MNRGKAKKRRLKKKVRVSIIILSGFILCLIFVGISRKSQVLKKDTQDEITVNESGSLELPDIDYDESLKELEKMKVKYESQIQDDETIETEETVKPEESTGSNDVLGEDELENDSFE